MTTDQAREAPGTAPFPALSQAGSLPPGTYRPARPARGPGRWFRACAGIREDVMDWVPAERIKYAGLGIIVVNTGCLAAFAMFTALGTILSAPAIALVPIALAWGWLIFSADRWLIASTHGKHGMDRVLVFIPRLVVAVLIAFTIAEPLTLRIFQNSLNTQVRTTRTTQLDTYQSELQDCNPVSGQPNNSSTCIGYHLTVADSAYSADQKLTTAQQQVAILTPIVNSANAAYQDAVTVAEGECAGTSGPGLSGQAGDGPLCESDRASASALQDSLNAKQARLTTAQDTVATLFPQVASAQNAYTTQLHTAITRAVAAKAGDLGQIGAHRRVDGA